MENVTVYGAILEIEAHANGGKHDTERYLLTLNDIRKSCLDGNPVIAIVPDHNAQPCKVKHFRYDYRCKNGCNHDNAAYGVLRYFNLSIIIDNKTPLGCIWKPNEYSELTLTLKENPYTGERTNLPVAKMD